MSAIIDLRDNGFSYPEVAVGDVLGAADPFGGRMEGESGDVVLWTTRLGVARGEVIGAGVIDGPLPIPITRVRVTEARQERVPNGTR